MPRIVRIITASALCLIIVLPILAASCKEKSPAFVTPILGDITSTTATGSPVEIVPYLPPSYYQCMEVLPMDLEAAFYSMYGNHAEAETLYDGKYFVFKNTLVDAFMLRELDKGWVWADLVLCPLINLEDAKKLKPGDRIDIVGICTGRDLDTSPGLVFRDCYVLTTGAVQLPAPGSGVTFAPGY